MDIGPLEPHGVELITGLVCFGVVFGVLAKFLLPRVEKVMAERDDAIGGTLDRATATQGEADAIHAEYKAQLAEAYRELAATRQEAREQGAAIIAAAREEGQRQRDALVTDAHAQLNVDRALAAAALNEHVRYLAVELASRIVGEPLHAFAHDNDVIDRFLDELTTEPSQGPTP
ncbi:F0F1 ATP synthase subunit B [Streptomyces sp. NPDC005426]|uniref:F0F1 ATP synthase subunit B n=1 Tax=Streptomyces sp. NPDC005426 TaxID=3155344 RepID=UPI0033A6F9CF